ncbi:MAG: FAD-dependent oxidoreductase [Acidobacteriota bacterium]
MHNSVGTPERPARIAVIGAGPAGFYTIEALLKQPDLHCTIDLFNRFPPPFGLVREGVAPDHQAIKSVTRIYDKIASDKRVRYFGNVTFGSDVLHEEMKQYYDQMVYAVGAQADRQLHIPGEDLVGIYSARAFVNWYNGHPDYCGWQFNLSHERVVVVGNGNVAMDVARILVTPPERLAETDIADYALKMLKKSKVREVVMLGRRGPEQAAFTTPELKELSDLTGANIFVSLEDLQPDRIGQDTLVPHKMVSKNMTVLREYAERKNQKAKRNIRMRFFVSPIELRGKNGIVHSVKIEKNELVSDSYGILRAKGSGQFETIETGMVLRSVGYRSVPLRGVPFDEAGYRIPNVAGRVVYYASGEPVMGEYVVGWAKRGASGVIGTNRPDAFSTVAAMIEDLPKLRGVSDKHRNPVEIEHLLKKRGVEYVTYADWKKVDAYELARGKEQNRPRVKVWQVADMLEIIRKF